MARKRMISREIWNDDRFGQLSLLSKLIFIGLITQSDDDGRFRADPRLIRGSLLPYHTDVEVSQVETAIKEIESTGMIHLYQIDRQQYGHLPNWKKHQKIRHYTTSQIPDCPQCTISGNPREPSGGTPKHSPPSQVKADQVNTGEDRSGQSAGGKDALKARITELKNGEDHESTSSPSTDLDPDDYHKKVTADRVCELLSDKFFPLQGRTKTRTNGNGIKVMAEIAKTFCQGEIFQGIDRMRRQSRGNANAVTDLPAYLLKTLISMREEDKFVKP